MKMIMYNIGPIDHCEMDISPFNVITGKQSSGKSTIAKCLYLFLSLKDELYNIIYDGYHPGIYSNRRRTSVSSIFNYVIKQKFRELFGSNDDALNNGMEVKMFYANSFYIRVYYDRTLKCSFSVRLQHFLKNLEIMDIHPFNEKEMDRLKRDIDDFFDMDYSAIYIPAGRSFMTTMGNQFSYFYYKLDDNNKRLIDLCTRKYFEKVMQLKPLFERGYYSMLSYGFQEDVLDKIKPLIKAVIGGEYFYSDGKEQILLENGKSIDINMASSGQQEALWIYNILLYYLIVPERKFFIIEEPESNLFPESQKNIMRLIAFVFNSGCQMLINTHSPYVLGELNNMIYAGSFKGRKQKMVQEVIDKNYQIKPDLFQAFFVEDGRVIDCMDYELQQIDNSKLDEISSVINDEYDRLLEIEGL